MTAPDPLLDALRALPRAEAAPAEIERVHRLARALVIDTVPPMPFPRPPLARVLVVIGAVVCYFAWAVLFVLATHLSS